MGTSLFMLGNLHGPMTTRCRFCSMRVAHGVEDLVRELGLSLHQEGVDQPIGVSVLVHAGRSWESAVDRASASMLARSARVAWCSRDLAVPTGSPVRAATSEIESPR